MENNIISVYDTESLIRIIKIEILGGNMVYAKYY